jgi:hypothetical protein
MQGFSLQLEEMSVQTNYIDKVFSGAMYNLSYLEKTMLARRIPILLKKRIM